MEKRKVRIRLKARTVDLINREAEEDADEIEYATDGDLTFDGRVMTLSYSESEELGLENSVTTLIFEAARPEMINMTRTGSNTASLTFDPETYRQRCAVNAAGMRIEFVIYTRRSSNSITLDEGGVIDLDYVLEFRGVKTERNIFNMQVVPAEALK